MKTPNKGFKKEKMNAIELQCYEVTSRKHNLKPHKVGWISSVRTPWQCTYLLIILTFKKIHQYISYSGTPGKGSQEGSSTRSHRRCVTRIRDSPNTNPTPEIQFSLLEKLHNLYSTICLSRITPDPLKHIFFFL